MLLENILRTLLQELVSAVVESGEAIMQYGQSIVDEDARPGQIPRLLDIVLYLCEKEHVEGGMIFQLLEDWTEMSTMRNCKDVFGYIESKQDIIGKPELFARGKLVMLRTCNQLLRRRRLLFSLYQAAASLSENGHSTYFSDNCSVSGGVCEVLTIAFSMIGEIYSRALRKVMDILASKSLLLEDKIVAMFYIELLHCLHLVLAEPIGYLTDHVAGFVAALRIFFRYGLVNKPSVMNQATNHMKGVGSTSQNMPFEVSNQSKSGPYRPPHLRKKVAGNQQHKDEECLIFPRNEFISSDSDCSDNDGSVMDNSKGHFAKARLAAIICVQDLCRADPKLFTAQWTMLLPSNDVLQHRKYDTTLMSCLLFDSSLKVRIAAASTIMTMLDGPASISLQVAEFREHSKHGSFTTLSSSLGHILMELHSGTLFLIKHETSSGIVI